MWSALSQCPPTWKLRVSEALAGCRVCGAGHALFHAPDISQNVMALAKQLKEQRSLTIRSSGRFAVGEVGEMKATAKSQQRRGNE
jgi:hypothetical protein